MHNNTSAIILFKSNTDKHYVKIKFKLHYLSVKVEKKNLFYTTAKIAMSNTATQSNFTQLCAALRDTNIKNTNVKVTSLAM